MVDHQIIPFSVISQAFFSHFYKMTQVTPWSILKKCWQCDPRDNALRQLMTDEGYHLVWVVNDNIAKILVHKWWRNLRFASLTFRLLWLILQIVTQQVEKWWEGRFRAFACTYFSVSVDFLALRPAKDLVINILWYRLENDTFVVTWKICEVCRILQ